MARRAAAPAAPILSGNFHARADACGLNTVSYLNTAIMCEDGTSRWLPRNMIGKEGDRAIFYEPADDTYDFAGWSPYHTGMFGGRRQNVESALAWMERAIDIRAGREKDFLGR